MAARMAARSERSEEMKSGRQAGDLRPSRDSDLLRDNLVAEVGGA
jgi:hypothetical protein